MGKVFGLLMIVLGVWLAMEYANGNAPFQTARADGEDASIIKRSGSKVQNAYDQGSARVDDLLEE